MDVLHVALIHAARKDHRGAVKVLLEHGADPAYRHVRNHPCVKSVCSRSFDTVIPHVILIVLQRTGRTVLDFELSKRMRTMLTAHLSGQAVQVDPEDVSVNVAMHYCTKSACASTSFIIGTRTISGVIILVFCSIAHYRKHWC